MARIIYSGQALDDLERLFHFLLAHEPAAATASALAIKSAVEILEAHPLTGRRVEGEIRELVISFGKTGYIALYRHIPVRSEIRVLSIRHQRELDYPE